MFIDLSLPSVGIGIRTGGLAMQRFIRQEVLIANFSCRVPGLISKRVFAKARWKFI